MTSSDTAISGKATGGQLEERIDLSLETSEKISQATLLVQTALSQQLSSNSSALVNSALSDALSILSALEKKCRVGNDTPSLIKVCQASLQLCRDANNNMEVLIATLKTLASRRSQKSKAIASLVETCLPWVVDSSDGFTPLTLDDVHGSTSMDESSRKALIEELRNLTSGKMYLEAERARLTRTCAILYEREGRVADAADVLGEVHVETYGSLSKREKVEFVLEQMRLTLMKKDYVRAHIVSNKIKKSVLDEEGMSILKVKYYTLLASYYQQHDRNALELAKCFHAIYSTASVLPDDVESNETAASTMEEKDISIMGWREALTNTVLFLCLSEYSNEVKDMLERVNLDPRLEKIVVCHDTIKAFLKNEIIKYPLPHQSTLEAMPAFSNSFFNEIIIDDIDNTLQAHWHKTFHTRIVQHNLRVISVYYRRIQISRLSQLLSLAPAEVELHISQMVSSGSLYAKIDRPKNIVRFAKKRCEEEVLTDWAADIKQLLGLVEETTYLINKEKMVQSH